MLKVLAAATIFSLGLSMPSPVGAGSERATDPALQTIHGAAPVPGVGVGTTPAPEITRSETVRSRESAARSRKPKVPPRRASPVAEGRGPLKSAAKQSAPAGSLVRNPTIRIGLTTDRAKVAVSCAAPFRVTDVATGLPVWKDVYREVLTIGIRGGKPTEGRTYRAQIASFTDKDAAEKLATTLRGEIPDPVLVVWMPDRRAWRVRAGAGDTRAGLADLVTKLKALGYDAIWIAEEPVPQTVQTSLVLVDENYDTMAISAKSMRIEPAQGSDAPLAIEGVPYRGSIEVRLDASGAVRVINAVRVESYLRGVVPSELGPAIYPELEALKAQAVAARTYVYRNLGQFSDEGFDLCDSPRCQVYSGLKAEHPLSDRAIKETEGEIATFEAQPIDALYTSTCGGHTEDASEIFPEDTAPYLAGVPCAPEERVRRKQRILLDGSRDLRDAGPEAAEAAGILAVHGLVPRSILSPAALAAPLSGSEAGEWIETLGAACGIARPEEGENRDRRVSGNRHGTGIDEDANEEQATSSTQAADTDRRGDAADPKGHGGAKETGGHGGARETGGHGGARETGGHGGALETRGRGGAQEPGGRGSPSGETAASVAHRLVRRLGWGSRVDLLVGRGEAKDWLPDESGSASAEEEAAVAYFIHQKSWPSGPGGRPDIARTPSRGDLARLMLFAAGACDLIETKDGTVRGGGEDGLKLSSKDGPLSPALASSTFLFADFGGGPVPVARVAVVPGDKVRYHLSGAGAIDYLSLLPGRRGSNDDRFSSVSSWEVAYTAKDLAKRLEDYVGPVGDLMDLLPLRRGVSGRVTQLEVVGTAGEKKITGFDIRTALGLKENLFVLTAQKDRKHALKRVVFTGRGWGHGVGMCQIGAYGMALRGATYREILTHYYTGITIERLP